MKLRNLVASLSVTAVPLLMIASVAQASVVDQNNAPSGNVGLNDQLEFQQQVTDGIAGVLAGVTLYTKSGSDTDTVEIGVGSAFSTGPFAFTTTATITQAGTFIDTSAADIVLTPGEHFVIDVSGNPVNPFTNNGGLAGSTSAYSGGDLFLNFGSPEDYTSSTGDSMAFQTYISPVPLPSAAWLMLSGIGGLGMLARKRKAA